MRHVFGYFSVISVPSVTIFGGYGHFGAPFRLLFDHFRDILGPRGGLGGGGGAEGVPRGPWGGPGAPKGPQGAQGRPEGAQGDPGGSPEGPKWLRALFSRVLLTFGDIRHSSLIH